MKVFEVITETCPEDTNKIGKSVQYVTSEEDSLKSVVDYFTLHCKQYLEELKGVREAVTIVQHIKQQRRTIRMNTQNLCNEDEITRWADKTYQLADEYQPNGSQDPEFRKTVEQLCQVMKGWQAKNCPR